ncbi:MAG TPA: preprotein translocase subunit SecG [Pirellulales bacterium]|jgi:preprotein translocase subunit SecG|nr:preprotein translocase subunit SecG [Pirellulales bacterium]
MNVLLGTLMLVTSIFLILLVLVQRGRGGGLAGALGGMGGQSAFGTKAGDLFTRITIGVAFVWIVLSIVAVKYYSHSGEEFDNMGTATQTAPIASSAAPSGTTTPSTPTAPTTEAAPTGGSTSAPAAQTPAPPATSAPATSTPSETPAKTP